MMYVLYIYYSSCTQMYNTDNMLMYNKKFELKIVHFVFEIKCA